LDGPPSGTVTFLFTDIEGSTRRWEAQPEAMQRALARHDAILRECIERHGGYVFKTVGDGYYAAFARPSNAVAAAVAAQRALAGESWSECPPGAVRMALHTGVADERDGDYFGSPLNRVSRLLEAGHGGQVLLSGATVELVRDALPDGVALRDLGEHPLRDLARPERIGQLAIWGLPADFPPLRTTPRAARIPTPLTSLIGREEERAAVAELLRTNRLVTLTGPGGTGKTRLALAVIERMHERFEGGVFFVDLSPIRDPAHVAVAIAQALGVREAAGQSTTEALAAHLRGRQTLVLLDNFEQVTPAATLVHDLLTACPDLCLLVTSRVPLRLSGELDYVVSPLAVPDPDRLPSASALLSLPALRLFAERAQAARQDFALTPENAAAVAGVCARLDGLPLAIELAAARVRTLPPRALLARLVGAHGEADVRQAGTQQGGAQQAAPLQLLAGGPRDLPARQQTLRETVAWSFDLLTSDEQTLFRRLAIFAGGCTLEAAEAVCGAVGSGQSAVADFGSPFPTANCLLPIAPEHVLDGISSLVEKSLVQQREQGDGEPRFRMLETIRDFALEQLEAAAETEALRVRHASFFTVLAVESERQAPTGTDEQGRLDRLDREIDNVRAALAWGRAAPDGGETILRLAGALVTLWWVRCYFNEGRRWLEEALARGAAAPDAVRVGALYGAGLLSWNQGDLGRAQEYLGHALQIFRALADRRGAARSLHVLGHCAYMEARLEETADLFGESLAHFRALSDRTEIGLLTNDLGCLTRDRGDLAGAAALLEESLAVFRSLGNEWGVTAGLREMGSVAWGRGDLARAVDLHAEALALYEGTGDEQGTAYCLYSLGKLALARAEPEQARSYFRESLRIRWRHTLKHAVGESLEGLAQADAAHAPARAARLFGAAEALREAIGSPLPQTDRPQHERAVAEARARLGDEDFTNAWAVGRAARLEAVVSESLVEADDARIA
jgi:predicted ATPase/class 3 adenylate cyclase